jgi:hypothetical protein
MSTTLIRKSPRATSASLLAATSLLALSAHALADPPFAQWSFADGETTLEQDNGWMLHFTSPGPNARGRADATNVNGYMVGTVKGQITGYQVDFTVNWDGGSVGKYTGSVDANGFASGVTYDAKHPGSSSPWHSTGPLVCQADRDSTTMDQLERDRRALEQLQPPSP